MTPAERLKAILTNRYQGVLPEYDTLIRIKLSDRDCIGDHINGRISLFSYLKGLNILPENELKRQLLQHCLEFIRNPQFSGQDPFEIAKKLPPYFSKVQFRDFLYPALYCEKAKKQWTLAEVLFQNFRKINPEKIRYQTPAIVFYPEEDFCSFLSKYTIDDLPPRPELHTPVQISDLRAVETCAILFMDFQNDSELSEWLQKIEEPQLREWIQRRNKILLQRIENMRQLNVDDFVEGRQPFLQSIYQGTPRYRRILQLNRDAQEEEDQRELAEPLPTFEKDQLVEMLKEMLKQVIEGLAMGGGRLYQYLTGPTIDTIGNLGNWADNFRNRLNADSLKNALRGLPPCTLLPEFQAFFGNCSPHKAKVILRGVFKANCSGNWNFDDSAFMEKKQFCNAMKKSGHTQKSFTAEEFRQVVLTLLYQNYYHKTIPEEDIQVDKFIPYFIEKSGFLKEEGGNIHLRGSSVADKIRWFMANREDCCTRDEIDKALQIQCPSNLSEERYGCCPHHANGQTTYYCSNQKRDRLCQELKDDGQLDAIYQQIRTIMGNQGAINGHNVWNSPDLDNRRAIFDERYVYFCHVMKQCLKLVPQNDLFLISGNNNYTFATTDNAQQVPETDRIYNILNESDNPLCREEIFNRMGGRITQNNLTIQMQMLLEQRRIVRVDDDMYDSAPHVKSSNNHWKEQFLEWKRKNMTEGAIYHIDYIIAACNFLQQERRNRTRFELAGAIFLFVPELHRVQNFFSLSQIPGEIGGVESAVRYCGIDLQYAKAQAAETVERMRREKNIYILPDSVR